MAKTVKISSVAMFLVLTTLMSLRGSAWAQSSQELTEVSVGAIQEMQEDSEQRLEALQELTSGAQNDENESAAKNVESTTTVQSHQATDVMQRTAPTPRPGEESFAGLPPTATKSSDPIDELQLRLAESKNPAARLAALEHFVEENPAHHDARLHLARALMISDQPGRVPGALAPLTESVHKRTYPDWQPWFWLGSAYLSLEQSNQARAALEVALSKTQDVGEIWLHLAIVEQLENNHPGALQYLQIARQLIPQSAQVHLNTAFSHERLGDLAAARSAYQHFLVADDRDVTAGTRPAIVRHLAILAQAH